MSVANKLKLSLIIGTSSAVMISSLPAFKIDSSLFFPSFIVGACSAQTENDDLEYGFAIFDFFRYLFG